MATTPITYGGDLAAFASPLRVHFTPPLDAAPLDDPRKRFVYAMALCARDIAAGELPGPYTDATGELYARALLMADAEFAAHMVESDHELGDRFGVPLEQVVRKRAELHQRSP